MKEWIFSLALALFAAQLNAQSYTGFLTDNYAGVHSVMNNPANIANGKYKVDINLGSTSLAAFNNAYKFKVLDIFKDNFDLNANATKTLTDNNRASFNGDILGPSALIRLNQKSAIALFTRARNFVNVLNIDGQFFDKYDNLSNSTVTSFSVNNQNNNLSSNTWAEIGASYATDVYQTGRHKIAAGLSLKYLRGIANAFLNFKNVNVQYVDLNNALASNYTFSGTAEFGNINSRNGIEDITSQRGTGFGIDLGLNYQLADADPKNNNDYKLKLGLSVTDFGSVKYDDANLNAYDLNRDINGPGPNGNLSEDQFNTLTFDQIFTQTATSRTLKAILPTALHLNADYKVSTKVFLNLNSDFALVAQTKTNGSVINNMVSLTPRFETKWFSGYLPLSYSAISKFQAGLGFRLGPIFLGSGSIITALASNTSNLDAYAGVKIPFFGKRRVANVPETKEEKIETKEPTVKAAKDSDADGLTDNLDNCPTTAGPKENNGCPWPDADGDGLLDKDDRCPTLNGPAENKGCPWPDSDGDGVLDKDDKCPTVVGLADNIGCPKITNEVVKKLNMFSKQVLFDNGKATIKPESFRNLDEMVIIMVEYPSANFNIEGHTDATGKVPANIVLSDNRARAIRDYLISKGITAERLNSKGFGAAIPIASNKTLAGRALNRRVEIKLAN